MNTPTDGDDLAWQSRAACRDHNPELFFPKTNSAVEIRKQVQEARAICATCPLASFTECAKTALTTHAEYGIWAGVYFGSTPESRQSARRKLATIAGIRTCHGCGRQLRATSAPAAPGVITHCAKGYCKTCYVKTTAQAAS